MSSDSNVKKRGFSFGPGILVTAAFVGPGTVITCSLAGANFGYSLLWALLFSVIATLILQEMVARLALVTGQGLGENIAGLSSHLLLKYAAMALVISAILIGNGAYQGGNISGAVLGVQGVVGNEGLRVLWAVVIGFIAFAVLWRGNSATIEKVMSLLVGLMSLAFVTTFVITQPSLSALLSGLFIPVLPDGATLSVIALIGTTVVPYNLFLYASSVTKKWQQPEQLNDARKDLLISIPLGGLISLAIVSTAASAFFSKQVELRSAADLAPAIQPLFGDLASIFIALGLFTAGISSAITAPLAAAYALSGILGRPVLLNSLFFRLTWLSILLLGIVISASGYKAVNIIWFAQVANGLLLPMLTVLILWLMNSKLLGEHRNNLWQNLLGGGVLLVTLMLSGKSLMSAFA